MEGTVPEWKKGSMTVSGGEQQPETVKQKLKREMKERFNKTQTAQNIYKSEGYSELKKAKTEYGEFKEDLKEHMENSQSKVVKLGMAGYGLA